MNKIIVQNGTDVDATYVGKILFSNVYKGMTSEITNAAAAAVAGGSLVADTYYYKVVAKCDIYWKLSGDAAAQLSDFVINQLTDETVLTWKLYSNGTTRVFELWKGGITLVAKGTRTGDGSITFESTSAEYGISGTVTVTFTGADMDDGNTLYIYRNAIVESDEVLDTAGGGDLEIDVIWKAITAKNATVYLYRGLAKGVYDGYFVVGDETEVSFADDGSRSFDFDNSVDKLQLTVGRIFLPEGYNNNVYHPCKNQLAFKSFGQEHSTFIDCNLVMNKPTWQGTTEIKNITAFNEFNSWL